VIPPTVSSLSKVSFFHEPSTIRKISTHFVVQMTTPIPLVTEDPGDKNDEKKVYDEQSSSPNFCKREEEQSRFTKTFNLNGESKLPLVISSLVTQLTTPHLPTDMRRTCGTLLGRRCAPFLDAPFRPLSLLEFFPTPFLSFEELCSRSCTSPVRGDTTKTLYLSKPSMMVIPSLSQLTREFKTHTLSYLTAIKITIKNYQKQTGIPDTPATPSARADAFGSIGGYGFPTGPEDSDDRSATLDFKPSMLLDVEAGRPCELEPIIGSLLDRARAKGVPTPRLDIAYATLKIHQEQATQRYAQSPDYQRHIQSWLTRPPNVAGLGTAGRQAWEKVSRSTIILNCYRKG